MFKANIADKVKLVEIQEDNFLVHGDCLEIMKNIPDGSVDLVAVDPPYEKTQNGWDHLIPLEPMWQQVKRVLKPKGIAVFTAVQPYTSMLVMSNLDWFKYDMVWQKTIGSGQLNVSRQPMRTHETVLVFYDNFGTYNEQTTLGSPYKIKRKMNKFQTSYGKQRDHVAVNKGIRRAKSVLKVKNPRIKGGHSTEKPVRLMEHIIKTYSNPGETVLDFAVGRGTTLVAAHNLDRKFIGIEKDNHWFEKASERIKNLK